MELKDALRLFLQVDRSESTRRTYRGILTRFTDDVGPGRALELVTPEDLDYWVFKMRQRDTKYADHPKRPPEHEPLSSATVYKRIKTVKAFFNWCVKRGYLEVSPARFLTNKRPAKRHEGKAATDAEVSEILGAAHYKPRDWAVVLLLVQSGCRAGDIASLRIENLDLENYRAIVDGKGGKRRIIVFGTETAVALRAWLDRRPDDAGHNHVFTSTRGHGPLTAQSVSQITRRLSDVAGLSRRLGAHSFRHFVAKKLWRSRVAPQVIKEYLGHSDITVTLEYGAEVEEEELHAASQLLSLVRKDPSAEHEKPMRWGTAR